MEEESWVKIHVVGKDQHSVFTIEVSSKGKFRNANTHELKQIYIHGPHEYRVIYVGGERYACHRLMAIAFLENLNRNVYSVVRLKDGNPANYWNLDNLEWTSRSHMLAAASHRPVKLTLSAHGKAETILVHADGTIQDLEYNIIPVTRRNTIRVCHRNWPLHRILAQAFIPNPCNFPNVIFLDKNKSNLKLNNLMWGHRFQ